jgi:hypothetical protein
MTAFGRSFVMYISLTQLFHSTKAISPVSFEYKEAAQKRQAEVARQMFCSEKAGKEKIMKRDLASFVVACMEAIERAEQAIKK